MQIGNAPQNPIQPENLRIVPNKANQEDIQVVDKNLKITKLATTRIDTRNLLEKIVDKIMGKHLVSINIDGEERFARLSDIKGLWKQNKGEFRLNPEAQKKLISDSYGKFSKLLVINNLRENNLLDMSLLPGEKQQEIERAFVHFAKAPHMLNPKLLSLLAEGKGGQKLIDTLISVAKELSNGLPHKDLVTEATPHTFAFKITPDGKLELPDYLALNNMESLVAGGFIEPDELQDQNIIKKLNNLNDVTINIEGQKPFKLNPDSIAELAKLPRNEKRELLKTLLSIADQKGNLSPQNPIFSPNSENSKGFVITQNKATKEIKVWILSKETEIDLNLLVDHKIIEKKDFISNPNQIPFFKSVAKVMKTFSEKGLIHLEANQNPKPLQGRVVQLTKGVITKISLITPTQEQKVLSTLTAIGSQIAAAVESKKGVLVIEKEKENEDKKIFDFMITPKGDVFLKKENSLLGEGTSKKVYETINLAGDQKHVWKHVSSESKVNEQKAKEKIIDTLREHETHRQLAKKNVPHILPPPPMASEEASNELVMIEQRYENFNEDMQAELDKPLNQRKFMKLDDILLIGKSIAETLIAMGKKDIDEDGNEIPEFVHSDLKLDNLLYSFKDGKLVEVIVHDFGTTAQQGVESRGGTPAHLPKEAVHIKRDGKPALVNGYKLDPSLDVFSLGVLLYHLITGSAKPTPNLFFLELNTQNIKRFFKGKILEAIQNLPEKDAIIASKLLGLCQRALLQEPGARIKPEQILVEINKLIPPS